MIYYGRRVLRVPLMDFELHDALIQRAVGETAREVKKLDPEIKDLKRRVEKLEKPDENER